MKRHIRLLVLLAAAALLVAPAAGQAHHKPSQGKGPKSPQPNRCKRPATNVGFVVRGTLTSYTADDPATPANETSVSITVTGANRHARNSGELVDTDPATPGTQVAGGPYSISGASDPFKVKLAGFEMGESPTAGDSVKIVGKISRTKAKCAAPGTSLADRYGAVDVRKVVIHDAD